ncbi:hypothetical protein AAA086_16925, partial [Dysosmobacter welbionis]|uniref:hypothetical protein n=1 Tax=Dysosmobacter welbionis TaxID=2093857 RepID=UPI0032BF6BC0
KENPAVPIRNPYPIIRGLQHLNQALRVNHSLFISFRCSPFYFPRYLFYGAKFGKATSSFLAPDLSLANN